MTIPFSTPELRIGLAVVAGLSFGFTAAVLSAGRDPRLIRPRAGRLPHADKALALQLERAGWPQGLAWFYVWGKWPIGFVVGLAATFLVAPVPGMLLGVILMGGPSVFLKIRLGRRRRKVQEAVMDDAKTLLELVKKGRTNLEAITLLGNAFGHEPIRTTWRTLSQNIRHLGWIDAFIVAQLDLGDGLFDALAVTLILNYQLGGDLIPPLEAIVDNMSHRDALLRQIATTALQQQISALLVPGVGIVAIVGLQMLQGPSGYMSVYDSFPGAIVEMIALGGFVCGYVATMWINRPQPLPRLLLLPEPASELA